MLRLLAFLSVICFDQTLAFTIRSTSSFIQSISKRQGLKELYAVAKIKKDDSVSSSKAAKIKLSDDDRNEMMLEIVAQLLEKMGESDAKLGYNDGQSSSSLSSDQTDLLNGVVRIYCTHSQPNFGMPWQRMKQEFSSSTGFVIDGNRILTNAHAVEYGSLIQVKKRSSEKKYVASVIAGIEMLRNAVIILS
jgi:S1-C subfamily serine protease